MKRPFQGLFFFTPFGRILVLTFFIGTPPLQSAHAQASNQIWTDASFLYPFSTIYRGTLELGERNTINTDQKWSQLIFFPGLEIYPIPFLDVLTSVRFYFTNQATTSNTTEIRPSLGLRLNFIQEKLRFYFEPTLEARHIHFNQGDSTENNGRFRSKLGIVFPINKKSIRNPKTLYGIADFEVFINAAGEEVTERYSSKSRSRLGLGYRFDLKWRAELIYTLEGSVDNTHSTFEKNANIFRISLKHQPLRQKLKTSEVQIH